MPSKEADNRLHKDSLFALQTLNAGDDASDLEGALSYLLWNLEATKWTRSLQWFENYSMLLGNHTTRFRYTNEGGFSISNDAGAKRSSFRTQVAKSADNQLIRPVETVVGMLVQAQLKPRVEPNSYSPDDEDAAKLGEILVQLVFENPMRMPEKEVEGAIVAAICGTAIFETEYGETDQPVSVPKMVIRRSANPLYDPDTPEDPIDNPKKVERQVESGETVTFRKDFSATVWTPFHIQPDPVATSPEDMTWISRQSFVDLDWALSRYVGSKKDGYRFQTRDEILGAGINHDNETKFALYWYARFQDVIETPQYGHYGGSLGTHSHLAQGAGAPNQVLLRVVDVKPSREFTHGRTLITLGGKLVWEGDARSWSEKYPWRWHPYAFHHWFKPPGRFWGVAMLSQLVPLQKKINAIDALVHRNRQHLSIGQWSIPKHTRMREGGPSGLPGENYTWNAVPGLPGPERIGHVGFPRELLEERALLINSIEYISASGTLGDQVSKSAARAGVMLDFFRQEKLRGKAPMVQSWERCLETIGQNILIDAQVHLQEEDPELTRRIMAAAKQHSSLSFNSFVGTSLRDHHAVKIDVASQLLNSPEARASKALEFLQARGAQATPQEIQTVLKATGLAEFTQNMEDASIRRAHRMVARVREGELDAAFPMPDIEQASTMLPIFQEAVLSDWFYDVEEDQQKALMALVDMYAQMSAKEQQQAMQQQLQMAEAMARAENAGKQAGQGSKPKQGE